MPVVGELAALFMDFPLVLGNGGAPLQDFNLNMMPDLNLPAEPEPYQPLFPQVPLGTLSLEELIFKQLLKEFNKFSLIYILWTEISPP
uniref:Uncharacterized protein n=1 Tax=Solanum tuberosum TaxID=4113 RepID=M1BQL7_SOLTU